MSRSRSSDRSRVDASGRAYAGSQRHIQSYVNWNTDELNRQILAASPALADLDPAFAWISPLQSDRFAEYSDAAFLRRLGLGRVSEELAAFWPDGGPVWDGLALLRFPAEQSKEVGVLLVEAKSYVAELHGPGCQAEADRSKEMIDAAFQWTAQALGLQPNALWKGRLYQSANRLAHLCFLRHKANVSAWLVNLCFTNDSRAPTSKVDWESGLIRAKADLGIPSPFPIVIDVILPAPSE